jgi:hypothetical protein
MKYGKSVEKKSRTSDSIGFLRPVDNHGNCVDFKSVDLNACFAFGRFDKNNSA